MGQREDVTASLLASHGVDGAARRKVASQVKATVDAGLRSIATTHDEVAMAASAVVMASDLRAPRETRAEFVERLAEDVHEDRGRLVWFGPCAEHDAGRDCPVHGPVPKVSPNRQGWRARLANVERLLSEFFDVNDEDLKADDWAKVQQSITEIRSMIDGEGE